MGQVEVGGPRLQLLNRCLVPNSTFIVSDYDGRLGTLSSSSLSLSLSLAHKHTRTYSHSKSSNTLFLAHTHTCSKHSLTPTLTNSFKLCLFNTAPSRNWSHTHTHNHTHPRIHKHTLIHSSNIHTFPLMDSNLSRIQVFSFSSHTYGHTNTHVNTN